MHAAMSSKLNTSKLVPHENLYSINNRQELTYQKNALMHTQFISASRFLNQDHDGNPPFFSSVYHFVTLSAYFKHVQ